MFQKKSLSVFLLVSLFQIVFVNLSFAQQSYFNVPSSDQTHKGDFFFQQQLNYADHEITSNSTFDWGIGENIEAGFNILQVNYLNGQVLRRSDNSISPDEMVYPLITLNAQYFKKLSHEHQLSIGAVSGFSMLNKLSMNDNAWLIFTNYQYHSHTLKLTSGIFAGNNHMLSTGTRFPISKIQSPVGIQIGCEIPVFHEKMRIIADYISGTHAWGVYTFGAAIDLPKHWILSFGGFFPNVNSTNPKGVVFEFTRAL